jgi:hypothetical protein
VAYLCDQWAVYSDQATQLTNRKRDFDAKTQELKLGDLTDAAKQISDKYKSDLTDRIKTLQDIQNTLLAMIQLTRLQSLLDGKELQECGVRLTQLQQDLLKQGAALENASKLSSKDFPKTAQPQKQETPKDKSSDLFTPPAPRNMLAYAPRPTNRLLQEPFSSPPITDAELKLPTETWPTALDVHAGSPAIPPSPEKPVLKAAVHSREAAVPRQADNPTPPATAPANGSAPENTSLTGQILDFDTDKGLDAAVVLLQCGTTSTSKYVTTTNQRGQYFLSNIPSSPNACLIRSARNLTDLRIQQIQQSFKQKSKAFMNGEYALTSEGKAQCPTDQSSSTSGEKKDSQKSKQSKMPRLLAESTAAACLPPQAWSYEEQTLNPVTLQAGEVVVPDIRLKRRKSSVGEFARALTGFEQSGASASDSAQKFFFDLFVSIPAPFQSSSAWSDPNFGPRYRIWGDARITTAPQQITSSLGDFAIGFASQIANVKVNEIAQAAQFEIGGEGRVTNWGLVRNRFFSFDRSTAQRFGLYGVASFGRTTTLNPKNSTLIYNNPPPGSEPNFDQEIANLGLTNQIAGKKYLAFLSDDRLKFYKDYYVGFRMKTYYYDADTTEPLTRFPATLDVLVGQNETDTGGRLRGATARIDGFYPFPFDSLKYIYFLGTADLLIGGKKSQNTILLQQATTPPTIPDPTIFLLSTPQLSRDHYRLAVGIDLLQLISTIKSQGEKKPVQTNTNTSTVQPQGGSGTTTSH